MTELIAKAFLAPAFFGFLALIPIVILLYLLKLRRTPILISSTLLWRKSLQDLTANAPFQRLRRNLLLLLQILVLLFLVFGLARPFVKAEGAGGNRVCVLIDRSASMQTMEGTRTRLDIAKEKALQMVDDLAGGEKMTVVTFAKGADVLCEFTDDRYQLRKAIRSITPTDCPTRIRDALLVANSFQVSKEGAARLDLRTVVVSDGKIADLDDIGSRAFDVSFLQIGSTGENAGIVAFSVRDPLLDAFRGDNATTPDAAAGRQCLVAIANGHAEPLRSTLTLYLNNESLAVEEVNVPANDIGEVLFALPNLDAGVLRVQLDHEDALPADNTAWLVLRPASVVKVLLVSEPEAGAAYFLKRVLSLNPRVELNTVTPANYAADTATQAGAPPAQAAHDIVIFDNFAPQELPQGLLLFLNALPPIAGLAAEGVLDNPSVVSTDPEHPLMRFLNPANVTIAKAQKLVLPEGARPLMSTRGGALIVDVSRGGQSIAAVAFDLADSNWPLRLSFPLFIQNLIAWAPKSAWAGETSVAAGEPIAILPAADAEEATVTLPDDRRENVKLDPTRPVYFGNTVHAGLYQVQCGGRQETHAVDLLDVKESSIAPAQSITVGRSEVAAQHDRVQQNRELWRWLLLAAIGVLTLEWWIYSRRAWI